MLTAESLFERYLWPLYPEDVRDDLERARTADANPAGNTSVLSHLKDAARVFVAMAPGIFGDHDPHLDGSDASVHRLSVVLTPTRRDEWASRGLPGTAENELFNVIVHGAAYVGSCIVGSHAGQWRVRRPLWESVVSLESHAGKSELAVLQWLVKSLADPRSEHPNATLADRYRTHVEIPSLDLESLPKLVLDSDRRIPRLAKVRYASLHQHLRAHVPELRDLGNDFPSPERFEAMRLTSLDFVLVGEGRMLALFGPGEGGAHMFWLTANGFEKHAHFPADAFPAPVVTVLAEKLRVQVMLTGKLVTHELLWWGP